MAATSVYYNCCKTTLIQLLHSGVAHASVQQLTDHDTGVFQVSIAMSLLLQYQMCNILCGVDLNTNKEYRYTALPRNFV